MACLLFSEGVAGSLRSHVRFRVKGTPGFECMLRWCETDLHKLKYLTRLVTLPWLGFRSFLVFCVFRAPGPKKRPRGPKPFIVYKFKPWTEVPSIRAFFWCAGFVRSIKKQWISLYFLYWLCIIFIISCIFRKFFSVTNSMVFCVFPARVVPKPYYSLYEIDGPDTCRVLFVWPSN